MYWSSPSKEENKQKLLSLDGTSCVACNEDDATKCPCLVSNSVTAGTDVLDFPWLPPKLCCRFMPRVPQLRPPEGDTRGQE